MMKNHDGKEAKAPPLFGNKRNAIFQKQNYMWLFSP
ncbi:unnamed protein product, partial [marine sediment metagenome]